MFEENFMKPCNCRNRSYPFILMDLNMPEMDGFEATKRILELTAKENQSGYSRVVALTSYTSDEIRERCLRIGFTDFINKPLHSNELRRMVNLHYFRMTQYEMEEKFPDLN